MNKLMKYMTAMFVAVLLLAGCSETQVEKNLTEKSLAELYAGDITKVDSIELIDGSSGNASMMQNQGEVEQLIGEIKDIPLTPDVEQEGSVGYVYRLKLYEGEQLTLDFTLNYIEELYYESNEQLYSIVNKWFDAVMK